MLRVWLDDVEVPRPTLYWSQRPSDEEQNVRVGSVPGDAWDLVNPRMGNARLRIEQDEQTRYYTGRTELLVGDGLVTDVVDGVGIARPGFSWVGKLKSSVEQASMGVPVVQTIGRIVEYKGEPPAVLTPAPGVIDVPKLRAMAEKVKADASGVEDGFLIPPGQQPVSFRFGASDAARFRVVVPEGKSADFFCNFVNGTSVIDVRVRDICGKGMVDYAGARNVTIAETPLGSRNYTVFIGRPVGASGDDWWVGSVRLDLKDSWWTAGPKSPKEANAPEARNPPLRMISGMQPMRLLPATNANVRYEPSQAAAGGALDRVGYIIAPRGARVNLEIRGGGQAGTFGIYLRVSEAGTCEASVQPGGLGARWCEVAVEDLPDDQKQYTLMLGGFPRAVYQWRASLWIDGVADPPPPPEPTRWGGIDFDEEG